MTGGDYQEKSRPLTKQVTRNFWPKLIGTKKARSQYVLQSYYGLKNFKIQAGAADRGMIKNQGKLYKVTDTTLYEVASDGTHTSLGTIPGSNRCILSAMGADIIIVNGSGNAYLWDDSASSLLTITDSDLGNPNGVAVLNNQAIYDDGAGQGWVVSDVGDASSIDGLNNANAESFSDDLVIPYAYRETLYQMGTETIELWWNSGQGNPPFDKIQGAVINQGLGAKYSVADNPDFIFYFGSDNQFHTLTGGTSAVDTVISTPAMAKQFQDYRVTNDCIGWTMRLEGQWFYVATFPVENVTWVYPVGGEWFQWGTGNSGRIRANSYVNIFGKHLVGDFDSGNIYELDAETYTDVDETIIRTRDSAPIHGGLFQQDGLAFEMNRLEFFLETGVGNISGQGSNPFLMISVSRDGGKTFGTERFVRVGKLGERVKVETGSFGRFEQTCVIRIRVSEPIFWSIYGAKAELEFCI
jgi:hypothetical protein